MRGGGGGFKEVKTPLRKENILAYVSEYSKRKQNRDQNSNFFFPIFLATEKNISKSPETYAKNKLKNLEQKI